VLTERTEVVEKRAVRETSGTAGMSLDEDWQATGMLLFDNRPAIGDVRRLLADHYRLLSYGLPAPMQVARHLTATEQQFVALGWAGWPSILKALIWIRAQSNIPVIVVGPPDERSCVAALEEGADDYLCEPASPRELLARIRAMLRFRKRSARASKSPEQHVYAFAGWEYDEFTRRLTNPEGLQVPLTRGEYVLLKAFLDSPRRPLAREDLIHATRPLEDIFDRSIDVRVARLRRKLSAGGAQTSMICTERGHGYRFDVAVDRRRRCPTSDHSP
jgi:two-component system, OmpR family, response regulator